MNDEFKTLKKELTNKKFLNVKQLNRILNKYKNISANSKAWDYVITKTMPLKIGNVKIGDDTLIINTNHALNCYCSKQGYCTMEKDCYAKKSSNIYINSCLYNIAAEINFNTLSASKIIADIEKIITSAKKPIKFIRFNESGDFISYAAFLKADKIATYFKNKYNIISYAYTHNKELEKYITDINNSNIVLNYSYGVKTSLNVKKCMVINESDIHNYIKNKKYVICTGSCTNCSYCKNKQDTRTVIFLNHVKKSITKMLNDNLNSSDIKKLEAKKYIDYGKFLLNTLK